MPASDLVGQVALILGGGAGIGGAIARSLSARGVAVVVFGPNEHVVARVVGEIAASGGKARHSRGEATDATHLEAAVTKALSSFGELALVIAVSESAAPRIAENAFRASLPKITKAGRLIAVTNAAEEIAAVIAFARNLSPGITCNVIAPSSVEPEDVAEIAAFLCTRAADFVTAQTITLTSQNAAK